MPRISLSETLHLIEVLVLILTAGFAAFQLRAVRLQNSADYILWLGQELDSGDNERLSDALDSDPNTHTYPQAPR
jgi:hypothetical protein